jgi:hypothetical protein
MLSTLNTKFSCVILFIKKLIEFRGLYEAIPLNYSQPLYIAITYVVSIQLAARTQNTKFMEKRCIIQWKAFQNFPNIHSIKSKFNASILFEC